MKIARYLSRSNLLAIGIAICLMPTGRVADGQDDLTIVHHVPKQPLVAATRRLVDAMTRRVWRRCTSTLKAASKPVLPHASSATTRLRPRPTIPQPGH